MRMMTLLLVLATGTIAAQSDINPDSHARLPYLQRKDMNDADQ